MPPTAHRRRTAASRPADSNHMNPHLEQIAQLKGIKHYWEQYGAQLRVWWSKQSKEDRRKFLLEWFLTMPLARNKPYIYIDGKKEDLSEAAMITPEWNQKEVLKGNRLIEILAETAEVPDKPASSPCVGHDAYHEFCYRNMPLAMDLVGTFQTKLTPEEYLSGFVHVAPDDRFGRTIVLQQMHPNIHWLLEHGYIVRSTVYEALMVRQGRLLGHVALCLDHFRLKVLGKKCYKAIAPIKGCALCGAVEPKDKNMVNLMSCAACGVVFYCGRECQHAHWRIHKPDCKPKALRDQEKNNRQQEAAASAAAAASAHPASREAANSGSSSSSSSSNIEQQHNLTVPTVQPPLRLGAEVAKPAAASRMSLQVRHVSFLVLILSASLMWICLAQVFSRT